jgi:MFS family permease
MSTALSWPRPAEQSLAIEPASLADKPSDKPSDDNRLRRDLRSIVVDGTCYNAMVGIGETYFSAFVLSLGMGGVACGLLTSLPMVCGALLQLAAPWGINRLGSYRAWVVLCALTQATSLLLYVFAQVATDTTAPILFIAATLYWTGALGAMPAWNTWVETIVPRPVRSRFFARRARFTQMATLLGFVAGGVALQWGASRELNPWVFAAMFAIAAACRYASAWCLATQSEPRRAMARTERLRFCGLAAGFARGSAGRLVAYLMAVQVAVYFSGPYFAPFIFHELQLSFADYTCLVGVSFVAKALCSPLYGRLAGKIGSRGLLIVGGIGIVPVAGMWLFSDNYWYLLAVQALAGATWAAYELAMALVFFDAIPRGTRTSVLAFYNFGNAAAQVTGALLGGWALSQFGENYDSYHLLFGLSSCGRFVALALLWWATWRVLPTRFAVVSDAGSSTTDSNVLAMQVDAVAQQKRRAA